MNAVWQVLQWIAAVGEIFMGYYAVEVFLQSGMTRESKKYELICSIAIGSLLAFNRHWNVGLVSWPILIIQIVIMTITIRKRINSSKLLGISIVVAYNICNALLQYLLCFVMISWGMNSDIQTVYMDMGIYRVSCYYFAIFVDALLLCIIRKHIPPEGQIKSFYKSFLLYGAAGMGVLLAIQTQLIGYGKERSSNYAFLLQIMLIVCFFILLGSIKSVEVRTQLELMNAKNVMLESNYREIKRIHQSYALTFHDLKNYLIVLDRYCKSGEMENAVKYIEKIRKLILQNYNLINSGNECLDVIVGFKVVEARRKSIKTEVVIEQVGEMKIEDYDLCCIIGNLMDNAMEACELVEKEKTWISISIHLVGNILLIHIANSCTENDIKKSSNSPKKELQGYGMQSVRQTVEKYGGLAKWNKNGDSFSVKITLFDVLMEKEGKRKNNELME